MKRLKPYSALLLCFVSAFVMLITMLPRLTRMYKSAAENADISELAGYAQVGIPQSSIDSVIDKGWILRDEFEAGSAVTRAQAVKTLMRMATDLEDTQNTLSAYDDMLDHPDAAFVQKARSYGILDDAGLFYPDDPVTKMQLVIWMDRLFSLPNTVDFESDAILDNVFGEDPEGFYAINKYHQLEIITLDASRMFHPNDALTMEEFADIIERLSGCGIKPLVPIRYEGQHFEDPVVQPR